MPRLKANYVLYQGRYVSKGYVAGKGKRLNGMSELPDDATEDESKLHADIIAYCRSRKWGFIHSRMDRRATATVGAPDFVILADGGRTFYIEAKRRNGKLSLGQLAFKCQAEFNGHTVYVVQALSEFMKITQTTPDTLTPQVK